LTLGEGIFLAVSGIDGSGKSTLIKYLRRYLNQQGFDVHVKWFGARIITSNALHTYASVAGCTRIVRNPRRNATTKVYELHLNRALRSVFPWTFFIDMVASYLLLKLRWILSPSAKKVMIYDRFLADALVDLMYVTRRPDLLNTIISAIFLGITNDLNMVVYLNVVPSTAYARKDDILFLDELEFKSTFLTRIYESMTNVVVVNANRELEDVLEKAIAIIDTLVRTSSKG